MSFQKAKAAYTASKRLYTLAGREVQVPSGRIHEWPKAEQEDWYSEWQSKCSSA